MPNPETRTCVKCNRTGPVDLFRNGRSESNILKMCFKCRKTSSDSHKRRRARDAAARAAGQAEVTNRHVAQNAPLPAPLPLHLPLAIPRSPSVPVPAQNHSLAAFPALPGSAEFDLSHTGDIDFGQPYLPSPLYGMDEVNGVMHIPGFPDLMSSPLDPETGGQLANLCDNYPPIISTAATFVNEDEGNYEVDCEHLRPMTPAAATSVNEEDDYEHLRSRTPAAATFMNEDEGNYEVDCEHLRSVSPAATTFMNQDEGNYEHLLSMFGEPKGESNNAAGQNM
ncbi:hypothetical protein BDW59DRAFT_165635 [Aspergillus cavernicola]|uniref:Stc1 domain-containing protein n=1 Tax=Aspergillus cavernicola TaxID=176166 RepID=A0ABR4HU22_9EURO